MAIINAIKSWITKDLNDTIQTLQQENKAIVDELSTYKQQADTRKQEIADKQSSIEPWVEIKTAEYDPVKGFRIDLDWNDAFIQYLKESGIKGNSDEESIQKWLGLLYADIIEDLEAHNIEDRENRPSNEEFI